MPEQMPKLDMARLAFLRGARAGYAVRIATAEQVILAKQADRREAIGELRKAEDTVRAELREAGVPEAECTLHHADRLVDAFLEGQATVKLGTFTSAATDAFMAQSFEQVFERFMGAAPVAP